MLHFLRSWAFPKNDKMTEANDCHKAKTMMEFAVQIHCQSCVNSISRKLSDEKEISNLEISLEKESVLVETSLPSAVVQKLIEETGRKAVLKGLGGSTQTEGKMSGHLGAAVAVVGNSELKNSGFGWSDGTVCGIVRFVQANEEDCIIEGALDGLSPGLHGLHIHECGDISQGCESIGEHYNPFNTSHGSPNEDEKNRHVGDLGNIVADKNGRATFRMVDKLIKTWDLIGRSVAVTEREDDLGLGNHPLSLIDGNCGKRLACGVVARSAGLFENPKRICACDGITLWDETSKANLDDGNSSSRSNGINVEQKAKY